MNEQAIKLICEKRGHKIVLGGWNNCFCEEIKGFEEGEWGDYWLLGFLKSKETLVECFGEELLDERIWGNLPSWQYHASNMGYTLEEVLKYYEEYLEVKE